MFTNERLFNAVEWPSSVSDFTGVGEGGAILILVATNITIREIAQNGFCKMIQNSP